jgi:hypothetical protein
LKLYKTTTGKVLIILYYALFFIANFVLTMFILFKTDSILAALGISIVLGFGIGILGAELEFRDHCKALHKKHNCGYRVKETNNIINFPTQT